jgi:PAS domain S-box-containing protein
MAVIKDPAIELESKSKSELIKEILALRNANGNSKSKIDINRSEELSKLIVDNSHDGIMIIGDDYEVEYVNKRLCKLTGYDENTLLNPDFRELLDSNHKKEIIERYKNRKNGAKLDFPFELSMITKDNKNKIFEIRSALFSDSKGNVKTLSHFKDITERKIAEETIRQSEEKFRSIVENSHLGILMLDMNYRFEYVNDQFCRLLRSTNEELIGEDFRKFLTSESLDLVVDRYRKRQQGISIPTEYEAKLLRSDGEERIVKLSSTVVNFADNIKTIAQVLDITENVKKENLQGTLLKISQAVNEVRNLSEFLKIVRRELSSILDTKNFYVALHDKNSGTYTFPYFVDEYDSIDEITQIELKDSLTDFVRRKNQAILVDAKTQSLLEEQGEVRGVVGKNCPIWLGAPLVVDNIVVGVIGLQNYHYHDTYNKNDLELLKLVSENVSSAIWRKQIVDKLTESELRYRDFITRSSEGIYRIDFDPPIEMKLPKKTQADQIIKYGTIGECNSSFAKMYGLNSQKDIIGKNLNFFYGNKISDENHNAYVEFINNNYQITDVEISEVNSKREEINILNNSIGITKGGFLNNIWGIQKDITQSKRLQNAIQKIAEGTSSSVGDSFFKSLVYFLGETLKVDFGFIAKLSEDKQTANSLAFWGKDKLIDNFSYQLKNSPSKLVLKNNGTTTINDVQDAFPNDKFLKRLKIKTYMGRPLSNSDGKLIGIIVILQESEIENLEFTKSVLEIFASRSSAEIERLQYVKEIVSAKDEAERSNNLKSDFLAQMSHEIRTPVNTILSFSSLLKESLEDKLDEELKDSFKIIDSGGKRLIRTIDLILNVSQIQSGSLTISPAKINLITILTDLISEFTQFANKKNLDLKFECEHKTLNVYADIYTITQIFANLIHNSIKYTTSGAITVTLQKNEKKETIVEVEDTGVGMSDEFLTQLFDPFSQEETGYTRKFEGTGLGLTLVRNYCELNNAEISVKSKKNKGSTFIIRFKK